MRLIDADALKGVVFSKSDNPEDKWDTMGVLNLINNAPTVEIFCHYQYDGEVKEPCVEAPCPNYKRPTGEWICPNCELYDNDNPDYCQYAGGFTMGCNKCHYFVNKEKR